MRSWISTVVTIALYTYKNVILPHLFLSAISTLARRLGYILEPRTLFKSYFGEAASVKRSGNRACRAACKRDCGKGLKALRA